MSTIYTVRDNLKKTIAGKETYLAGLKDGGDTSLYTLRYMLNMNIEELKIILFDVEKACEEHSLAMWELNPDRMGQ